MVVHHQEKPKIAPIYSFFFLYFYILYIFSTDNLLTKCTYHFQRTFFIYLNLLYYLWNIHSFWSCFCGKPFQRHHHVNLKITSKTLITLLTTKSLRSKNVVLWEEGYGTGQLTVDNYLKYFLDYLWISVYEGWRLTKLNAQCNIQKYLIILNLTWNTR